MWSLCHTENMGLSDHIPELGDEYPEFLDTPTYLRRKKPAFPTTIHKSINLSKVTDSNLQAISVLNQLDGMKSGEVLKVEGELSDACAMNIREFSGAKVLRSADGAFVISARSNDEAYLDVPAIVRVSGKGYEM